MLAVLKRLPLSLRISIALAVAVFVALTWRWTISPASVEAANAEPADAVVMFVGGRGERLETALELMGSGVAPVLVIPNGTVPTWPEANELCAGTAGFEVVCPSPEPNTTHGEARAIAAVANERGWESVIVVTSTYHLSRAELRLSRCFDGAISAVRASPDLSISAWVSRVTHEWLGHIEARVLERGC